MGNVPFLFIAALFFIPPPVTVHVYPALSLPPATFRITVLAPRHAANRAICYGYDGPERKQSCLELHGEASQRVWTVYWLVRTSGEYQAAAVLTRIQEGRINYYSDARPFRVVGDAP